MSHEHKLSLPTAIMINLNIMLGVGMFINPTILAERAGILGALGYVCISILMLPLILSITTLLTMHPAGGFYAFGKEEIHPFVGFIGTWSYFTGKLATACLMIHTAVSLIQQLIPMSASIPPLICDFSILTLFITLNMLNMKTGSFIQSAFMVLKSIPVIFAILVGLFLVSGQHFTTTHQIWSGLPSVLPIVLYVMLGFEAACSLSSKIENPTVNAPRAVLISYGIVITITTIYQLIMYGALGPNLGQLSDYRFAFPSFLDVLLPAASTIKQMLVTSLHLAIASSALGGAYGVIFSNNWNLYTLAQNNHTFMPQFLMKLNGHHIPAACVLVEGIICALYFLVSMGDQLPLQQTTGLACTLAYTSAVVALLWAKIKRPQSVTAAWWIPIFGTINCMILITSCIYNLMQHGISSLTTYACFLAFGTVMFFLASPQKS